MGRDFQEVVAITRWRQGEDSRLINQLIQMRNRYNGEWVIPLFDVDNQQVTPNIGPALVAEAIDSTAMRAASVLFNIESFPLDMSKIDGAGSREFAEIRRKALGATLYAGKFLMVRRRYYRHLAGYATCSLLVVPDPKGYPCVQIRDPLTSYPEKQAPEDTSPPENIAYVSEMSAERLRRLYPKVMTENGGPVGGDPNHLNEMWSLVEWVDADEWIMGLMGPTWEAEAQSWDREARQDPFFELMRHPNRAGVPIGICPRRVTLDKITSQVANLVGHLDIMSRLYALDIVAQERSIFPDRYVIGREGQVPRIVGGRWKDGREGDTNLLESVDSVGELRSTPDVRTGQLIDRLERDFRISTGLVPQTGGETYGALRTGRGIDALMGAALDMRIQEMHEMSESFLPHLMEGVLATYRGYWGGKKYSMVSAWRGAKGRVEFQPRKHFEPTAGIVVTYPITGLDITQTTVQVGQLRAAKGISNRSFRRLHPYIEDPDSEDEWIDEEDMDEALKTAFMQQLMSGQLPPIAGALLQQFRRTKKSMAEAILMVDEKMREMQSAMPQPPEQPDQMMNPQMAPGLLPGAGPNPMQESPLFPSQAVIPGMTGPTPDQADLRRTIMALKTQGAPKVAS